MATEEDVDDVSNGRRLFHTTGGTFDLSRLIEQMVPLLLVGGLTIYANNLVLQSQLADLKMNAARTEERVSSQNEKIIGLSAQVIAYLAQQNQLNNQFDSRITYMERAERERGIARR